MYLYLMRTMIVICVLLSSSAWAEPITSFPYTNNFDSAGPGWWRNPTTTGANVQYVTGSTCYGGSGGCTKLTPPTSSGTEQTIVGLGGYALPANTRRVNIRALIKIGNQYEETARAHDVYPSGRQNKMFIVERGGGGRERGMTIFERYNDGAPYFYTWGACEDNTCIYNQGLYTYYPGPNDPFKSTDHPDEWVCIEVEYDLNNAVSKTYIWTRDGLLSGLHMQKTLSDTVGTYTNIQVIGGFFNGYHVANANAFLMFDNLVISNSYIGPPAGFVSGKNQEPSPPSGLRLVE